MIIFPAIDILSGKCVRLTQGNFDAETVFAEQPVDMAKRWAAEGAEFLHVVDLDGALKGQPVNTKAIAAIVKAVDIPVQLGGGIRSLSAVSQALQLGVKRVILGSVAVKQPELVREVCQQYKEAIAVGIDARDGMVAVEGWGVSGNVSAGELAKAMAAAGVARIIYTDISRDGMLSGINVEATREIAKVSGLSVIASGGARDIEDIVALKKVCQDGIEGVIVGKAIYTGSLDLKTAIQVAKGGV